MGVRGDALGMINDSREKTDRYIFYFVEVS